MKLGYFDYIVYLPQLGKLAFCRIHSCMLRGYLAAYDFIRLSVKSHIQMQYLAFGNIMWILDSPERIMDLENYE